MNKCLKKLLRKDIHQGRENCSENVIYLKGKLNYKEEINKNNKMQ